MGMLEDAEYNSVDVLSPFLGAIVDRFWVVQKVLQLLHFLQNKLIVYIEFIRSRSNPGGHSTTYGS